MSVRESRFSLALFNQTFLFNLFTDFLGFFARACVSFFSHLVRALGGGGCPRKSSQGISECSATGWWLNNVHAHKNCLSWSFRTFHQEIWIYCTVPDVHESHPRYSWVPLVLFSPESVLTYHTAQMSHNAIRFFFSWPFYTLGKGCVPNCTVVDPDWMLRQQVGTRWFLRGSI